MENYIKLLKNIYFPEYNPELGLDRINFEDYKNNVGDCVNKIFVMLEQIDSNNFRDNESVFQEFLIPVILLCGGHSHDCLWSNKDIILICQNIINKICSLLKCNIGELLSRLVFISNGSNIKIGALLLSELRPKLLRDKWKQNPDSVMCYKWIISNLKVPYMCELMHMVFPTTLNILDDYQTENKILGLQCLKQILKNLTPNQLQQYCSPDLFYQTIKPILYWKEEELIVPLIECILQIIEISSIKNWKKCAYLKWSPYADETLSIFLPIMEFEDKIPLQVKYMEALYAIFLFPKTTLSISRWSSKLVSIFHTYSISPDTELLTMKVLRIYLSKCYPLISEQHGRKLSLISGKIVSKSSNTEAIAIARENYIILYKIFSVSMRLPSIQDIEAKRLSCNN